MEDIEIEIQVKIGKPEALLEFLDKNGKLKYKDHQVDEYFTPAHRDFKAVRPVKEWLRLRDSSGKFSITYKNWYFDDQGRSNHCCDEYETPVEDITQIKNIFSALNFKSLAIVDKIRQAWDYKDYEVAMDSVKGLGDFVEIEYKGKETVDPNTTAEEMIQFLKDIGCGKIAINHVGYPFQIMFPEEVKFEEK